MHPVGVRELKRWDFPSLCFLEIMEQMIKVLILLYFMFSS